MPVCECVLSRGRDHVVGTYAFVRLVVDVFKAGYKKTGMCERISTLLELTVAS